MIAATDGLTDALIGALALHIILVIMIMTTNTVAIIMVADLLIDFRLADLAAELLSADAAGLIHIAAVRCGV